MRKFDGFLAEINGVAAILARACTESAIEIMEVDAIGKKSFYPG
ncbi:hypothetical protein [Sinorhizobium meliloti]|nr:hypothetical protein [Sinorhizobium meliloti]